MNQIAGVILAAGKSTRMGKSKALLEIGSHTFLSKIISILSKIQISPIYVVLGNDFEIIKIKYKSQIGVQFLFNPNFEKGQLSSLQVAIRNFSKDVSGFMLALVDHPLVRQSTYQQILKKAQQNPQDIIIPVYKKKRGHPVYFGRKFLGELLNAPLNVGARYVVQKYKNNVLEVVCTDPGILKDIDTPQQYKKYTL